jgi:hypothetical protein
MAFSGRFLLPNTSYASPETPNIQAKRTKQEASGTIGDIIAENPHQEESKKEKKKTDVNRSSPIFNESRLFPFVIFPPHLINSFLLALISRESPQ